MNSIPCTDPCLYQQDGYCFLSRAVSMGQPHKDCIHFLPKTPSQKDRQSLPDVFHRDEL